MELTWEKPCRIDHVMLMENIANGQKVANYTLEAFVDGKWQAVVPANRFKYCPEGYNASPGFETIGHKKIDRIVPVVTDKLRFRCTKAAAEPVEIAKFAVWNVGKQIPPKRQTVKRQNERTHVPVFRHNRFDTAITGRQPFGSMPKAVP
ncbi:MAG: hypothetical protein ACLTZY_06880 [Alistipes indistinctus]